MSDRNLFQLLSKAEVIREYRFPEHQLTADIRAGSVPAFLQDGTRAKGKDYLYGCRYYIPRYAVEDRIRQLAEGEPQP